MAEEPAKLTLKGSSQKIKADRGSVAILTADIIDSKGNHVYGANNTVKWTVTGPAILVGPSEYESDIDKHQEMEGVWYMDMPVSNVIRSTGKPGKIHVIVSAGGLASGSFDIDAEEMKTDEAAIIEPVLDDKLRSAVPRPTFFVERLDEVPQEIKNGYDEFNLNPANKQGYARAVKDYILKNNPGPDTSSVEFRTLIRLFTTHLLNNNGRLVADDYNFSINHYNNCRLISGYIASLKLPQLFKDGLRQYYSDAIIRKGAEKNAGEEMNWLNWIPSGGTVVVSVSNNQAVYPKGTIITSQTNLPDIIALVYPVFKSYSDDGKERALTFISKMNPYVKVNSISEQSREGDQQKVTKVTYTAEKDRPILIPLIKFISD
jgi:hypothetical protein